MLMNFFSAISWRHIKNCAYCWERDECNIGNAFFIAERYRIYWFLWNVAVKGKECLNECLMDIFIIIHLTHCTHCCCSIMYIFIFANLVAWLLALLTDLHMTIKIFLFPSLDGLMIMARFLWSNHKIKKKYFFLLKSNSM